MTLIRNRGTAGDVLNGTNTGLVKVEGPAVWFSGDSGGLVTATEVNEESVVITARGWWWTDALAHGDGDFEAWISNWGTSHTNRAWAFGCAISNTMKIYTRRNADEAAYISIPAPFTTDGWKWIRATVDQPSDLITLEAVDSEQVAEPSEDQWVEVATNAIGGTYTGTPTGYPIIVGSLYETGITDPMDGPISYVRVDQLGGTNVFEFDAATDISDPAATSFTATSGQTLTVNRASTGPVTTLVPAGKTVLINPDPTESPGLRLDVEPSNEHFALAETDDFMLFWVGQIGNATGGYPQHVAVGGASTSNIAITHQASSETTRMAVTGDGDAVIGTGANYIDTPATQVLVHAMWLDRETDLVTHRTYDADGLHSSSSANAEALTTTSGVFAVRTMYATNGSMSAWSFRKGVGIAAEYDDTTLAALASYLLTEDI